MIQIYSQYLGFILSFFDPECAYGFSYFLSDGTIWSSVIGVLDILLSECRAPTDDLACCYVGSYTCDLCLEIDTFMFAESVILDRYDCIDQSSRETSLIGNHISTRRSLVRDDPPMGVSEDETAIWDMWRATDREYARTRIPGTCQRDEWDYPEGFYIHDREYIQKNLLTNRIFHYNRLTSIGDSRFRSMRGKNSLPRWTRRA